MMRLRQSAGLVLWLTAALPVGSCGGGSKPVLNQQAEAHTLAARLHVEFSLAADASNRAVMADTDDASRDASHAAQQATQQVERDAEALRALADTDEIALLDKFKGRFAQYRALDGEILPLAVENTNIKAQRLAFGPAQEAVGAFRTSIEGAGKMAAARNRAVVAALVAGAAADVLEVQVIEARHIAESDEAAMSRMESAIKASEAAARKALESLKAPLPPAAY